MSIESEVSNLTAQTTALLDAVNVAKATLDAKVTAAAGSAGSAAAEKSLANTARDTATAQAVLSAGSASQALAIYGTTNAMQAALNTAALQSQLAQTAASSASSVLQQDLSAVSAALHRSPNPVTAMCLYDTSKDSDGGAWVERMQHTSWANEPLAGAWLPGGFATELAARGDNLLTYPENVSSGSYSIRNGAVASSLDQINTIAQNGSGFAFEFFAGNGTLSAPVIGLFAVSYEVKKAESNSLSSVYESIDSGDCTVTRISVQNGNSSTITLTDSYVRYTSVVYVSAVGTVWRTALTNTTGVAGNFKVRNIKINKVGVLPSTYSASPELVSNGGFTSDSGWVKGAGWTISGGVASHATGTTSDLSQAFSTTVGKAYRVSFNLVSGSLGAAYVANVVFYPTPGVNSIVVVSTNSTAGIYLSAGTGAAIISDVSIKEVTTLATPYVPYSTQTNSYYQSSADGKYYKLGATYGALTEVFRGNTAKFPRLAMIVAEASNVTIYDLTQPGRPMWMRFAGAQFRPCYSAGTSSLAAINGKLVIGCSDSSYGIATIVDFIGDSWVSYRASSYENGGFKYLATRNNSRTRVDYTPTGIAIVNNIINAVAATILPDAPFDVATGIQIPTIAVATNGGVSIIKHDGTVVNWLTDKGHISSISMTGTGQLFATGGATVAWNSWFKKSIPSLAVDNSFDYSFGQYSFPTRLGADGNTGSANISKIGNRSKLIAANGSPTIYILQDNQSISSNGSVVYLTDKYNTGYMVGDIRRAYLCNTEVESVAGTELVTNGTFDTDTAGWVTSPNYPSSSIASGGEMQITAPASFGRQMYGFSTVIGKKYILTGTARLISGTGAGAYIGYTPVISGGDTSFGSLNSNPTPLLSTIVFLATTTTSYVFCTINATANCVGGFDNISVKEFISDRSYRAASASIMGTLVKSLVA